VRHFSCRIGPLIFPIEVSWKLAMIMGLYAVLVFIVVMFTLAPREKVDKGAGVFLIFLYLLSYATLYLT